MPLLDHFHPPLAPHRKWEAFHSGWASALATHLNERLPEDHFAEETTHIGPTLEIDVATMEQEWEGNSADRSPLAGVDSELSVAVAPSMVLPSAIPETFEVRVISTASGPQLVAAIELVSLGNKDRPAERHAFVTKCASLLYQGINLILVDIVTNYQANLHNEMMGVMELPEQYHLGEGMALYVVSYRPVQREERIEIETWTFPLALGSPLPVMPLFLRNDVALAVDFESTYRTTCRTRRIA